MSAHVKARRRDTSCHIRDRHVDTCHVGCNPSTPPFPPLSRTPLSPSLFSTGALPPRPSLRRRHLPPHRHPLLRRRRTTHRPAPPPLRRRPSALGRAGHRVHTDRRRHSMIKSLSNATSRYSMSNQPRPAARPSALGGGERVRRPARPPGVAAGPGLGPPPDTAGYVPPPA